MGSVMIKKDAQGTPLSREEIESDLLETFCRWHNDGLPVMAVHVCQEFDIAKRTLSTYLKQMYNHGYVTAADTSGEICLTSLGLSTGNHAVFRHTAISAYLQFVGVPEDRAYAEACRVEHVLSEETVVAICDFFKNGSRFDRAFRHDRLSGRYAAGCYRFLMGIFQKDVCCPRRLREEYHQYQREILLEVREDGSWFELQRKEIGTTEKKLMYCASSGIWAEAKKGKSGERIPASVFRFVEHPGDTIMEGEAQIAFVSPGESPDGGNCCVLDVEIW